MRKQKQDIKLNVMVYQHRRLIDDEIFYIGIGVKGRPYTKRGRNKHWISYTNKYEYIVDILFENLTWEEACIKEKSLILYYGRRDLKEGTLVNMTDGGEGVLGVCKTLTAETKRKIGDKSKGRTHSEDTRQKMSDALKGRIVSQETREKISKGNKNKKLSVEHKQAIANANKGKKRPWLSERNKSNIGRQAWNKGLKGLKKSQETKDKIRETLQKTRLKNKSYE